MLTKLLTAWGTGRIGSFLAGRLKLAYIVLNLRLLSVYIPIGLPYTSPTGSQDTLPPLDAKQPCCETPGVISVIVLSCALNYTLIDVNISVILTNRNVTASSSTDP